MNIKQLFIYSMCIAVPVITTSHASFFSKNALIQSIVQYFSNKTENHQQTATSNQTSINDVYNNFIETKEEDEIDKKQHKALVHTQVIGTLISPEQHTVLPDTIKINVQLYDLSQHVVLQEGNTCGAHSVKNNAAIIAYLDKYKEKILNDLLKQDPCVDTENADIDSLYHIAKLYGIQDMFIPIGNLNEHFTDETNITNFLTEEQRESLSQLILALKNKKEATYALSLGNMHHYTSVLKSCDTQTCTHCPQRNSLVDKNGNPKVCKHRDIIDDQGTVHKNICSSCQTDYARYGHWIGLVIHCDKHGKINYYYTNSTGNVSDPELVQATIEYRTDIINKLHTYLNTVSLEMGYGVLNFTIQTNTKQDLISYDNNTQHSKNTNTQQPQIEINTKLIADPVAQKKADIIARRAQEQEDFKAALQVARKQEEKRQVITTQAIKPVIEKTIEQRAQEYFDFAALCNQTPLNLALSNNDTEMVQYFLDTQ